MEVGCSPQHGALVAREYGKPFVTGIQGATDLFHDGETVTVNEYTGVDRKQQTLWTLLNMALVVSEYSPY